MLNVFSSLFMVLNVYIGNYWYWSAHKKYCDNIFGHSDTHTKTHLWARNSCLLLLVETWRSCSVHPVVGGRNKRTPVTWLGEVEEIWTSWKYAVTEFSNGWASPKEEEARAESCLLLCFDKMLLDTIEMKLITVSVGPKQQLQYLALKNKFGFKNEALNKRVTERWHWKRHIGKNCYC